MPTITVISRDWSQLKRRLLPSLPLLAFACALGFTHWSPVAFSTICVAVALGLWVLVQGLSAIELRRGSLAPEPGGAFSASLAGRVGKLQLSKMGVSWWPGRHSTGIPERDWRWADIGGVTIQAVPAFMPVCRVEFVLPDRPEQFLLTMTSKRAYRLFTNQLLSA
jgi:hypothetical protein